MDTPLPPVSARRRLARVVNFPPVLLLLGFLGVGLCIGMGAGLGNLLSSDANRWAKPLLMGLTALVGYGAFVRLVERRQATELAGDGAGRELAAGLAIGLGLFSTVIGALWLMGYYTVTGSNPVEVMGPVLAVSIMAGVTEELLIRGLAFRILEAWLGSWIALALTAALFGALHLPNPGATLTSATAIALEAGVMLAAAFMLTRRLWLAIGIHAGWNFTQTGLFGVATSGQAGTGLLKGELSGPVWLSGGNFGPEASAVAVVVCVAMGLTLLGLAHRRGPFMAPFWRRT